MPAKKNPSSPKHRSPKHPPLFLLAGPWEVEEVEVPTESAVPGSEDRGRTYYAVVRRGESIAEGDTAFAVMLERATALQVAASLCALAGPHTSRYEESWDPDSLARLLRKEPALEPLLQAARGFVASPDALGLLLESLDTETLELLDRTVTQRLQRWGTDEGG